MLAGRLLCCAPLNSDVRAMSVSYVIYNALEEWADMSQWDSDHFLPIGNPSDVIDRLNRMFEPRTLKWDYMDYPSLTNAPKDSPYVGSFSALELVREPDTDADYIDLSVTKHERGYACEISARKGSPGLIVRIMEEFQLRYVLEIGTLRLVNPYDYEGNWEPKNSSL